MSEVDRLPSTDPIRAAAESGNPAALRNVHTDLAQDLVWHHPTFPIAGASIDPHVCLVRLPLSGVQEELQSFVQMSRNKPVQRVCGEHGVHIAFIDPGVPNRPRGDRGLLLPRCISAWLLET